MVSKPQQFQDRPALAEIEDPTLAEVEAQVAAALAVAGFVDATQVAVTMVNGVVVLDGFVNTTEEIDRVAEVALSVQGVATVRNAVVAVGREPNR